MSADKILEMIKQNPALSSKNVFDKLKQTDPNFGESYRTVQKHLTDLHREGILETHSIGREVVYSPKQNTNAGTQDYFMTHIWNRLFELNEKISIPYYHGAVSNPAYSAITNEGLKEELMSIVEMLPPRFKNQLKAEFVKLDHQSIKESYPERDPENPASEYNMVELDTALYNRKLTVMKMGKVTDLLHAEAEPKTT
jgi:Fe2+ or Zn2+ uptake regulation protein